MNRATEIIRDWALDGPTSNRIREVVYLAVDYCSGDRWTPGHYCEAFWTVRADLKEILTEEVDGTALSNRLALVALDEAGLNAITTELLDGYAWEE